MSDICLDYTHLANNMCEIQGTLDVSSTPSRDNHYLTFFDLPEESINITKSMDWHDITIDEIFIGSNLKIHDYETNAAHKVRDELLKQLPCSTQECYETIIQGINKVLTDVAKKLSMSMKSVPENKAKSVPVQIKNFMSFFSSLL